MSGFHATILALLVLLLGLAGCGGDNAPEPGPAEEAAALTTTAAATADGQKEESAQAGAKNENRREAKLARRPPGEEGLRVPARRARIVTKDSKFGPVLFDANGQVVYVFENDRASESSCTSAECVEAWPPVLTRQKPSAGADVDARLLGTIRRADGGLQVTYDGRPLYFYEHEAPGEIKCHNVDLHGGLWWVVTRHGDRAD